MPGITLTFPSPCSSARGCERRMPGQCVVLRERRPRRRAAPAAAAAGGRADRRSARAARAHRHHRRGTPRRARFAVALRLLQPRSPRRRAPAAVPRRRRRRGRGRRPRATNVRRSSPVPAGIGIPGSIAGSPRPASARPRRTNAARECSEQCAISRSGGRGRRREADAPRWRRAGDRHPPSSRSRSSASFART